MTGDQKCSLPIKKIKNREIFIIKKRNKKNKERGNGEGTIYFSEALQCYVAQYIEPSGKRKTLKQKKNEKTTDFKKRFNTVIANLNNGTYIESSKETLINLIENFVEQKYKNGLVSNCTHNRDLQTITQIKNTCINFYDKPIQKVTINDIEASKEKMREYSNSVIDKMWLLLNKAFKIAISRRIIYWNPMEDITMIKPISKKTTKVIEALTIEAEQKLIDIFNNTEKNHKYKNIILLQLNTGMRIGEVLALSLDDIDIKNKIIRISKTLTRDENERIVLGDHTKTYNRKTNIDKGKRDFPITKQVEIILSEILNQKTTNIQKMLFWDYKDNKIVVPVEINSYLSRLNKKYKICSQNLTSHVLRHTFVTRCREKGVDFGVLQKIVGHIQGSTMTNEIYTSISKDFISSCFKTTSEFVDYIVICRVYS